MYLLLMIQNHADNKPRRFTEPTVYFQPKSDAPSESGKIDGVRAAIKSSMLPKLDTFKNFLNAKLKKEIKPQLVQHDATKTDNDFHGFSDNEIRSASLNDSSSERSSIISSLSLDGRRKTKPGKAARKATKELQSDLPSTAGPPSGLPDLPLLHRDLVVEGKRQKKPSFKLQVQAQVTSLVLTWP
jgi:hypothetical protein